MRPSASPQRCRVWIGLFVARIGAGISGATISTAQAYIADSTTTENRTKGMALIGAAFGLGFTFGPLLAAAALISTDNNVAQSPWPGYVAAAISGCAFVFAFFKLPESKTADSQSTHKRLFDFAHSEKRWRFPRLARCCWFLSRVNSLSPTSKASCRWF